MGFNVVLLDLNGILLGQGILMGFNGIFTNDPPS